ncbi:hypothetical protein [Arhodomonas sp. AD133]|uniref:hypothetical protein n=1 Tax=Arhodomonas sp. AD133 TaxID=3415009 RepID=UPI003EBB2C7A
MSTSTEIHHVPQQFAPNRYAMVGEDVDDIIRVCSWIVRPQSWDFYKRALRRDLERYGKSLIDPHAGSGNGYSVYLTGYTDGLIWPYQ